MDKKFTLDNMTYEESSFEGPHGPMVHNTYKYIFPSGHELNIYTNGDGSMWMGTLFAPEKELSCEIGLRNSPKAVLGAFIKDLNNNKFDPELIDGFAMWEEDLEQEDPEKEALNYEDPQE